MATATYAIAELAEGEEGGFAPRGAVKELWSTRDHECMIAGPAETGKTYGCLQYLDAVMWKYPGAQGVICRKTLAALIPSAVQTYRKIIGERSPIKAYGGEKPEWFQYPNGSRLWIVGLDNPGKALSSERDIIYVNQSEELAVEDWETLTTRCTGRAGNMPYARIFGDCNPDVPSHWILNRQSLKVLYSYHEDNPTLFDDDGNITERGRITLSILDNLTGVRKDRLRYGKWVQAEGAIYEGYDRRIHLIARRELPREWNRYWGVDFGYTNPFVWQEWVEDPDGRLYRYRELYLTQTLVEDALSLILPVMVDEPRPRAIICDHDAEDRATFERHCVYCAECKKAIREDERQLHGGHSLTAFNLKTKQAYKAVSPGIQAVAGRLKIAGDGKPRLYYVQGALIHEPDSQLVAAKKAHSSEQEIEAYVWDTAGGRKRGEEPKKENDHGQDAKRYVVAHVDDIGALKRSAGRVFISNAHVLK